MNFELENNLAAMSDAEVGAELMAEAQEIFKRQAAKDRKLKNRYRRYLKSLIYVPSLYKYLDQHDGWMPEAIVDIVLTDEKLSGYASYQHARIVDDEDRLLYMKTQIYAGEDEYPPHDIDHYYVWQTTGQLGDDYSGYLLFPLKDGRYFKVSYSC